MAYTLNFSDTSKADYITVPDMPPGINTVDTSLNLVGKGYPNYGLKYAENFLHLLENFASAVPPENPIEGQLWYDTSDPNHKVLRVMDGTTGSSRWPSASGIYQQATDPKEYSSAGLKSGDIWVDTANNQLKIFNSNNWTPVGPFDSSVTGQIAEQVYDVSNNLRWIIKHVVDSNVVSVTTDQKFTPRVAIPGFSSLKPGINLSLAISGILNGTALSAQNLEISNSKYSASTFLRKNDTSNAGQIITGKVIFQTAASTAAAQGRDGLLINTGVVTEYIQLYKSNNDAVLLNNKYTGKIIFKTRSSTDNALLNEVLSIDNGVVGINTSTTANSPTLDVYGTARVASTLTVSSTSSESVIIQGGISVAKNISVLGGVTVTGVTTTTGLVVGNILPTLSDSYDIGSASNPFRELYVSRIASTGTGTIIYGTITGNASGLTHSSEFKLQGQVTATSFLYAGTSTEATFNASLTRAAIADQEVITTPSDTLTLMVLDTSTNTTALQQISKPNFLSDILFPGLIQIYAVSIAPSGWLLCDGSAVSIDAYSNLYAVIGNTYNYIDPGVGNFRVPDIRSNAHDDSNYPIYYIIKT